MTLKHNSVISTAKETEERRVPQHRYFPALPAGSTCQLSLLPPRAEHLPGAEGADPAPGQELEAGLRDSGAGLPGAAEPTCGPLADTRRRRTAHGSGGQLGRSKRAAV